MRLTTLCVCGTLLAFASWIRAEDGPVQGDRGFGPCAATLRPGGACRPGQHGSTCPYLFSLPPLTVHLPRHLRELENIVQDLQKLKDSVDELRKMCADCTESRTERKCGEQREKEHGKQNEGKSEEARSWANVRLEEAGGGFKHEHGNDGEKVEKADGDNSTGKGLILEGKSRNEWETDGKSKKGVVKENEREETQTEVGEKDGKTKKETAREEGRLEQEKVPTAGGNTRTVDVTSKEVFETTHRETTDLLDALKGNLKGFQEDMLENAEEKKMSTDVKTHEKTKEDSDLYVWREEINKTDKKSKTEASDRIKMSENHENHEENINKEREEHREETRKEKGIKVDQNNEKLKHTESTKKEKAIKEGEEDEKGREMGTEIKTKHVQGNDDRAISSRKTTEGTDFLSISPTTPSSTKLASEPDPNKVTIFTSSLPSPPLPSSTLSSITDVSRGTKDVYGLTQSAGLGAADTSEPKSHEGDFATRTTTGTALGADGLEVTGLTTGFNAAFTVKPGAGLRGHERSTTTSATTAAPHQGLTTTASPRVPDHRRWTPKRNISSNIKTGLKPPPRRVLRPGDKHKPGIKPEAEQKLKNPKNDRKPNQAPAPDKKAKYNQKQKPAPHRPTAEKPKPGKDSDRKTPPHIPSSAKNLKNNLTRPSPPNKLPFQKPKSSQKPPASVQKPASQRPQTVNPSHPDKYPSINKTHVSDEKPVIDQNSKSETSLVDSFMTNEPDQRESPEKVSGNEENTKLDRTLDLKQNPKPVQESDSKKTFTPKPNQEHLTESVEIYDENPLQEPESNPNVKSGQKITSNAVNVSFDWMNKSSQDIPERKHKTKLNQDPKNNKSETAMPKPNKPLTETVENENPLEEPGSNLDLIFNQVNATFDQRNKSSQEKLKIKPKPTEEPTSKTETAAPKHNQKPSAESVIKSNKSPVQEPESDQDLITGRKITSNQVNATSEQITSSQEIPEIKHHPKPHQEPKTKKGKTTALKPNQKPLTEDKYGENPLQEPESNQDLNYGQIITSGRVNATSDQMNNSNREISKSKPKTKPKVTEKPTSKTKTAAPKPDRKPPTKSVGNENSVQEPESHQDLMSGEENTSEQVNATSEQMNTSSREIPEIKHQPKPNQEPKTKKGEIAAPKPNKRPLSEDKSAEYPLQEPEPNQDLNYEQIITSSGVIATSDHDQTPEFSQEIISIEHESKTNQEFKPKIETATPKPEQNPSAESEVDEKPLQEPESNKNVLPGQKITSDRVNASLDQITNSNQDKFKIKLKPKPNQEPKSKKSETVTLEPNQKPLTESVDKSGEKPLQEPESNQDLNYGQIITSSGVNSTSDQTPESSQEIINNKDKPKTNQEPKLKTETMAPTSDQNPSTESEDDENLLQEPETNQDLNYKQIITSSGVIDTSDQTPKSSQEIISIEHKPKTNQEPKLKTEAATPKPDQNPSAESEVDEKPLQEPESNKNVLPGQKITSDQVNASLDQITNSNQDNFKIKLKPNQEPKSKKSETVTLEPNQKPLTESGDKSGENPLQEPESNKDLTSGQTHAPDKAKNFPVQKLKPSGTVPNNNKRPKPGPEPKQNQKHPKVVTGLKNKPNTNLHTERTPWTNSSLKTLGPNQNINPKLLLKPKNILTTKTNRTSKPRPPFQSRPLIKPGAKPVQRPKPPAQPKPIPKTKTRLDPPKVSWTPSESIPNSQTDMPPTSGFAKQISEVTHSPGQTDTGKTSTMGPKTSDRSERGHSPRLYTHAEDFTLSPSSRIMSDLRPQTASQPPSIPMTTRPNKINRGTLRRVITSTSPGSTQPSPAPKSGFGGQDKILYNTEETAPANPILSPGLGAASTPSPDFLPTTRATSGHEPSPEEATTPSARELRVKINQVAAFVNGSLNPNRRAGDGPPKQHLQGSQRGGGPDGKLTSVQTKVMRDCSDHLLRGQTRSGVYLVTPDLRSSSFQVFCDMERAGGGWTVLQRRQDGSVSFNRTWAEYRSGFGVLDGGEFWLGNRLIHLLTRDRDMALRVELKDFDDVTEHARYEHFRVAGERQRYRLTVGGYSGTAGDALRFSSRYDHNNRAFTTPDRDHDRYPSGNCGAYYSSGWWFDACMAANLNGKYYVGNYKGVRDGVFWGTWHNISREYYPTNERQSFKSVRMMIRPKSFAP